MCNCNCCAHRSGLHTSTTWEQLKATPETTARRGRCGKTQSCSAETRRRRAGGPTLPCTSHSDSTQTPSTAGRRAEPSQVHRRAMLADGGACARVHITSQITCAQLQRLPWRWCTALSECTEMDVLCGGAKMAATLIAVPSLCAAVIAAVTAATVAAPSAAHSI